MTEFVTPLEQLEAARERQLPLPPAARDWSPHKPDSTTERRICDSLKQVIAGAIHKYAAKRIASDLRPARVTAFSRKGRGSSVERAKDISMLLADAAPIEELQVEDLWVVVRESLTGRGVRLS